MKTLINSQSKFNLVIERDLTNEVDEKFFNSKIELDLKLFQKLSIVILSLCTFLMFPESPQDSDLLCAQYQFLSICKAILVLIGQIVLKHK